jgi:hypothetical protein
LQIATIVTASISIDLFLLRSPIVTPESQNRCNALMP